MRGAQSADTVARGEVVEAELDGVIRRRDTHRRETEGKRLEREVWQESADRHAEAEQERNRLAWLAHFERMRAVDTGLAQDYGRRLRDLGDGAAWGGGR